MLTEYQTPYGQLVLKRFPEQPNESLQAWDSADHYLLSHLRDHVELADKRVLVVNDLFGALTVPLLNSEAICFSVSDSIISERAYRANCALNNVPENRLIFIAETESLPNDIDVVVLKIPKSLMHLEEQLLRIKSIVKTDTIVVAAEKTKNIHNSTLALFEKIIGVTTTSLAWKKSRLIFSAVNNESPLDTEPNVSDGNYELTSRYELSRWDLHLGTRSSVFSQSKLDHGTSFLLEHLKVGDTEEVIVDLACGNGVIGLVAKRLNPKAKLVFVDESYMAVHSAKQNYHSHFNDEANFIVDDCLSSLVMKGTGVNKVLCNPPFHQQNAMGKTTAHKMLRQACELLLAEGEIWVVANRHLGYHTLLNKQLGNCEVVAGNRKFVVLRSCKI